MAKTPNAAKREAGKMSAKVKNNCGCTVMRPEMTLKEAHDVIGRLEEYVGDYYDSPLYRVAVENLNRTFHNIAESGVFEKDTTGNGSDEEWLNDLMEKMTFLSNAVNLVFATNTIMCASEDAADASLEVKG